jgi:hypothetical protein
MTFFGIKSRHILSRRAVAEDTFSADYITARRRFRDLSQRAGADCHVLPISAHGPNGAELSIDIAVLGSRTPRRVVLHSSGLHGVEGFVGSALQLQLLGSPPPGLEDDTALVLVHVLNPYGMAWLRRVNESNVDLNRNFIRAGEQWQGADATYARLNDFLNPASPPGYDAFYLRAALAVMRFGFATLQQAVAGGQYEFAQGLFFGGRAQQQGPRVYEHWLGEHFPDVEKLVSIDVHSGLGPWATGSNLVQVKNGALSNAFYSKTATGLSQSKTHLKMHNKPMYHVRGGQGDMLTALYPGRSLDVIVQEFGTYGALRVLHALREENRLHHFGDASDIQHPARRRLREMFCPHSRRWRQSVIRQGITLVNAVLRDLQINSDLHC